MNYARYGYSQNIICNTFLLGNQWQHTTPDRYWQISNLLVSVFWSLLPCPNSHFTVNSLSSPNLLHSWLIYAASLSFCRANISHNWSKTSPLYCLWFYPPSLWSRLLSSRIKLSWSSCRTEVTLMTKTLLGVLYCTTSRHKKLANCRVIFATWACRWYSRRLWSVLYWVVDNGDGSLSHRGMGRQYGTDPRGLEALHLATFTTRDREMVAFMVGLGRWCQGRCQRVSFP